MTENTASKATTRFRLDEHRAMLEERVFQVDTKWPHFRLLLDDIQRISCDLPRGSHVVSLERTLLYGGISLFAPFFSDHEFVSVDCSPGSADTRGAYNAHMIDDPRVIRVPFTHRGREVETGVEDDWADLVIVPNLVHHVGDQDRLFSELARITKSTGSVYVFEPILRELHQVPDDYLRYTPYGMSRILQSKGFEVRDVREEGGPFSAIAYCWEQALQYVPDSERPDMERWFFGQEFARLLELDQKYTKNLARKNTSFPVAFSVLAEKAS